MDKFNLTKYLNKNATRAIAGYYKGGNLVDWDYCHDIKVKIALPQGFDYINSYVETAITRWNNSDSQVKFRILNSTSIEPHDIKISGWWYNSSYPNSPVLSNDWANAEPPSNGRPGSEIIIRMDTDFTSSTYAGASYWISNILRALGIAVGFSDTGTNFYNQTSDKMSFIARGRPSLIGSGQNSIVDPSYPNLTTADKMAIKTLYPTNILITGPAIEANNRYIMFKAASGNMVLKDEVYNFQWSVTGGGTNTNSIQANFATTGTKTVSLIVTPKESSMPGYPGLTKNVTIVTQPGPAPIFTYSGSLYYNEIITFTISNYDPSKKYVWNHNILAPSSKIEIVERGDNYIKVKVKKTTINETSYRLTMKCHIIENNVISDVTTKTLTIRTR